MVGLRDIGVQALVEGVIVGPVTSDVKKGFQGVWIAGLQLSHVHES